MRVLRRAVTVAICVLQSALLALPAPALAAGGSGADQLCQYEKFVFGKPHPGLSEEQRLKDLEMDLFGQEHSGSFATRLHEIADVVGKKHGSLHLQPLIPTYDRSEQQAPSPARDQGAALPPPSPPPIAAPRPPVAAQVPDPSERVKDLLRKAIAYHGAGNNSMAEKTFRQVLQIDPGNSDAHFSLGALAEARGDLEGADQHYKAALKASPDDTEIQQAAAAVEGKMRDRQQAAEQQREVAQQEQQRQELKKLSDSAAKAYRNGNYDQAIRDLEEVRQKDPQDPDVEYALAQAYRGKGNYPAARYHIRQAVALDPGNQMYRSVQSGIDQESNSHDAQMAGNPGGNSPGGQLASSGQDGGPPGQLTPIQPETGFQPMHRGRVGYYSGGGGYSSVSWGGGGRLRRVMVGGLAGAATGAALGGVFGGRRGMGRGALFGGLAGLIFGGF